jgi:hypothetical protein
MCSGAQINSGQQQMILRLTTWLPDFPSKSFAYQNMNFCECPSKQAIPADLTAIIHNL